ncbi:restriction endonuclease subunit S [Microbacterium sp. A94]|uniref:restriction endonuclease subunit S n=1 Tax=Microbacterium sp. A94 TaxID=3450717 RepID=UPI003F4330EF
MSRISELVHELCPNGVEHKTFGEMGTFIRGGGPQKKDFVSEGVGCIHYGQIYTHYGIHAAETTVFVSEEVAAKSRQAQPGDVVIAVTGENDEDLARGVAWLGDRPVAVSNHTLIYTSALDPKYVSYFLRSSSFDEQKRRHISGTKVRSLSSQGFVKIRIPVPPLEVQREIVRVLDQFAQLEAELEAELEARRHQYEHYRSEIVERSQLGEKSSLGAIESRGIIKLGRGKVISKIDLASNPGEYPVYSSSGAGTGEFGRYGLYMFDDERISWSVDGGGRFFYRHPHRFSVTNVSGWMTVDTSILRVKYLYYALTVQWEKQSFDYTRKAHPSVIRDVYEIAIPPFGEQDAVVDSLDAFDALVNDLSIGLPAELAARRKQYEYYRDKLLTFKEPEA